MTSHSKHYKRFIFDLDDTISHCTNRDFENATPDLELIAKINKLFDEGYEIWIVTARGMLSCDGDLRAREEKYREQILKWLNEHKVRFDYLSFQKELGAYYVDDKALSIADFMKTDFTIKRGLSGNEVFITDNKLVSKTCDNALAVARWHERASDLQYHVPEVHSIIGKTINFEYIEGKPYKPGTIINKLCDLAESFKQYQPLENGDFTFYIARVQAHLAESELTPNECTDILNQLKSITARLNTEKSFCHGDFTVDNLIITKNSICMLDPNPIQFSSWLLDISKLAHSLRRFGYNDDYHYLVSRYMGDFRTMLILELTHWVRILKYVQTKDWQLYSQSLHTIREILKQL